MENAIYENVIEDIKKNESTVSGAVDYCMLMEKGLEKSCDISEDCLGVNTSTYANSNAYYDIGDNLLKAINNNEDREGNNQEKLFKDKIISGEEYVKMLNLDNSIRDKENVSWDDFENLESEYWTYPIDESSEIIENEYKVVLVVFNSKCMRWGQIAE